MTTNEGVEYARINGDMIFLETSAIQSACPYDQYDKLFKKAIQKRNKQEEPQK